MTQDPRPRRGPLPAALVSSCLAAVMLLGARPANGGPFLEDARPPVLVRTERGGPWSDPTTWEGGQVPKAGARV